MAGYKVIYFPEAVVVHHHRRDSAQGFSLKTVRHIWSAIRFLNKYGWKW
jgi:GT2 family glycosyltransferase